jgi:hypothetical protein
MGFGFALGRISNAKPMEAGVGDATELLLPPSIDISRADIWAISEHVKAGGKVANGMEETTYMCE